MIYQNFYNSHRPHVSLGWLTPDQVEADFGIRIFSKPNQKVFQYIIELNQLISDRINNCASLFPIWLEWRYIKELFIMPSGLTVNIAPQLNTLAV